MGYGKNVIKTALIKFVTRKICTILNKVIPEISRQRRRWMRGKKQRLEIRDGSRGQKVAAAEARLI